MYEKILVPLDGSTIAELVLPYAEEIAAKFGAEISLFSVCEADAGYTENLYRSYLKAVLSKVQHDLKDWGTKEAKIPIEVASGKPAIEILRYADENNISLIILAGRGSSGEGPWPLGNIAVKVLRIASKPVLMIRAPAGDNALKEKRLVKKILVPLDGSRVGEAAIPHAEALAQTLDAKLVLFQVVEPAPSLPTDDAFSPYRVRDEKLEKAAFAYIDGMKTTLSKKGLIASGVVLAGYPADEIINYAEANAIDLIAISTHGRSGVGRWAIGSVTDKILYSGDTPVLVEHATI